MTLSKSFGSNRLTQPYTLNLAYHCTREWGRWCDGGELATPLDEGLRLQWACLLPKSHSAAVTSSKTKLPSGRNDLQKGAWNGLLNCPWTMIKSNVAYHVNCKNSTSPDRSFRVKKLNEVRLTADWTQIRKLQSASKKANSCPFHRGEIWSQMSFADKAFSKWIFSRD